MSHDVDPGSRATPVASSFHWNLPVLPLVVIATGSLLALLLWTLPTWGIFASNVAQFPALWQISSNRQTMIILVVKVCSPILIGLILGTCFWLWDSLKPFLIDEKEVSLLPETVQPQKRTLTSPVETVEQDRATAPVVLPSPAQLAEQSALSRTLPSLPSLPPTLADRQAHHRSFSKSEKEPAARIARKRLSGHAAQLMLRRQQRFSGLRKDEPGKDEHRDDQVTMSPTFSPGTSTAPMNEEVSLTHPSALISVSLLKEVTMTLHAPGGISRVVPLSLNAKRVQLLAYIACMRGEPVKRERLLEQVFGHGRPDEEASPEKLGEAFDSHKKLLRADVREAVAALNTELGREVIPPDIDIFGHKRQTWRLSALCRVPDLETIEAQHRIIAEARRNGSLADTIPEQVKAACDALMAAYTGDFLETLIRDYLDEFEPWASSWARKPFTLYRDYYLQAVWYAAEYEWRMGQRYEQEGLDRENEAGRKQREHWGRAAQFYRTYAMHACNNRFDTKVTFGAAGREYGERVIMSERALRRSVVLYGAIGSTHIVDEVYSAYYKHMRLISSKMWEPSKDTLADVQAAKEQTNAYRFPAQFAAPESPLKAGENA